MDIEQYFKAVCFYEFQRMYLNLEWHVGPVRKILIETFDKKKSTIKHIFNDNREMSKGMNAVQKEQFARVVAEFEKARGTFVPGKATPVAPADLEGYFHLVLESGNLFADKSKEPVFHQINQIILETDVRKLEGLPG